MENYKISHTAHGGWNGGCAESGESSQQKSRCEEKKFAKKNLPTRMSSTNFRLLHQKFPSSVLGLESLRRKNAFE